MNALTQVIASAALMSFAFGVLAWLLVRAERREERQRAEAARRYQRLGIVPSHKRATRFENERQDY